MQRNTKIVATFGPSSAKPEMIQALILAGVNVARLNFSHGTHRTHQILFQRLRHTAAKLNLPLMILQDLQGPKIRIGKLNHEPWSVKSGEVIEITPASIQKHPSHLPISFKKLPKLLSPKNHILLDDGHIELEVVSISSGCIKARVLVPGDIYSHKGVNLIGVELPIASLTPKDLRDLKFGVKLGVDAVAISFVRGAEDIEYAREVLHTLRPNCADVMLIAKLERPEALRNLEAIIQASDGVMVARGDLGIELSPQAVPIAQKQIINTANQHLKIVITATQMLDSMINSPRPTRAESSDVANAIFDGSDAVMLSGETAHGRYPLEAVIMMHQIILQAEKYLDRWGHWRGAFPQVHEQDDAFFMSLAAKELAHDRNVAAIAVFTMSGRTARYVSKVRPSVPVLAFTPREKTFHKMSLFYGVVPHLVPEAHSIEEMLYVVENAMVSAAALKPGQQVVLICGYPIQSNAPSNLALLHTIGELR